MLNALLEKDDVVVGRHLCSDSTFQAYLYDRLNSDPRLTHHRSFDFETGRDTLIPYPCDVITDELIKEETDLAAESSCVLARLDSAIIVSVMMLPSMWAYIHARGWAPATNIVEPDDISHLVYLGDFFNTYAEKWQRAYGDPDFWLHAKPKGRWSLS